jgi:NAD(P)-dependent dehydrogenase (short-subunit alcohol dehydrogenase family)
MGLLEDKTAIVTGAGRGLGREHALLLAAEGAAVVVNDVDAAEAQAVVADIEAAGGRAAANTDDVASFAGAEAMVTQAVDTFGELDILVNNAGILRDAMSFSMTEDDWDDVIRVHLKGHFAPSHVAGKRWRERSKDGEDVSGRIINSVSESGLYGLAGQINYAAAKAGIASMTVVLARELRKYGVTCNAICPRARTRMTETVLTGMGPNEDGFDEWDPANISPTVAWLASDLGGDVTGQLFVVFANRIHLMAGWSMVGEIEKVGRWTPEEIAEHSPALFGNHSSGLPKTGFGR